MPADRSLPPIVFALEGEKRGVGRSPSKNANQLISQASIVGVWGEAPPRKPGSAKRDPSTANLQASKLPSFLIPFWRRKVGRGSTACERGRGNAPHIQSANQLISQSAGAPSERLRLCGPPRRSPVRVPPIHSFSPHLLTPGGKLRIHNTDSTHPLWLPARLTQVKNKLLLIQSLL